MPKRAELILEVVPSTQAAEAAIAKLKQQAEGIKVNLGAGGGMGGGGGIRGGGGGGETYPSVLITERAANDAVAAERAAWDLKYRNAKRLQQLEMERDRAISRAAGPKHAAALKESYAQQIAQERREQTFTGSFMSGWDRAAGFGSALGTVTKYAMAYTAFGLAVQAAAAPLNAVRSATIAGAKDWIEYEETMADAARTFRQVGVSAESLKRFMGEEALDFMSRYRVSIQQVAQAQYELGSANFDASDILQAYQTPLKVAIALNGDVTQTTQLLTQMLKIHGDTLGENMTTQEKMIKLGGILYKTWEIEQVELSDLAAAYKYVAGSAAALKLPAEQLIPLLGFLSTYGMRGSTGGTRVNQFFAQLSKNIVVTEGQITKLQKSVKGMDQVINLKPGSYKPMELLIEVSKAMQKLNTTDVGRLLESKALQDFFNIRGAGPGLLLSDAKKLAQLLKSIADVSGLTTKGYESLYEAAVKLRQETPKAQWEILQNNLFRVGAGFFSAAAQGYDLVDALKNVNGAISSINFDAIYKGAMKVAGAFSFWVEAASAASEQGVWNVFAPVGIYSGIKGIPRGHKASERTQNAIADARFKQKAVNMYMRGIADPKNYQLLPEEHQYIAAPGSKGKLPPAKVFENFRSNFDDILNPRKKNPPTQAEIRRDVIRRGMLVGFSREQMENLLADAQQHSTAGKMDEYMKRWNQNTAKYAPVVPSGGGGGGGGSATPAKTLTEIADDLATQAMRDWEDKVAVGLMSESQQLDKLLNMKTLSSRINGKEVFPYKNISLSVNAERISAARRMSIEQAEFTQKRVPEERVNQTLAPLEESLRSVKDQLSDLDATEKTYGTTIDTISEKVRLLVKQEDILKQTRDANNNLLQVLPTNYQKRYEQLKDVYDTLLMKKPLAGKQLEAAKGLLGTASPTVEEALSGMQYYEERIKSLKATLSGLDSDISSVNSSIVEFRNEGIGRPLSERMERLTTDASSMQNIFRSLGKDWDSSSENLDLLSKQIDIQKEVIASWYVKLMLGTVSLKQFNDGIRQAKQLFKELAASQTGSKDQQDAFIKGLNAQDAKTRAGWLRGSPREMVQAQIAADTAEVNAEIDDLSKKYGDWAKDAIDTHALVRQTDVVVSKWLDARDRIEKEWSDMFTNVFANMAEGSDPWPAVDAIIKSIQGQIIQGWVKQHLSGLFSAMATDATGINPATIGTMPAANTALGTLATQADAAATALQSLTSAAGGGINPIAVTQSETQTNSEYSKLGDFVGKAVKKALTGGPSGSGGFDNMLSTGIKNYSEGSLYGGILASITGRAGGSVSTLSGLGAAIGGASVAGAGAVLGGGLIGGLVGLLFPNLFGGSPAPPPPDPSRSKYGMPEFEEQAYMYNLYKSGTALSGYMLGSNTRARFGMPVVADNRNVGKIVININGGDPTKVKEAVQDVLKQEFGPLSLANARTGSSL